MSVLVFAERRSATGVQENWWTRLRHGLILRRSAVGPGAQKKTADSRKRTDVPPVGPLGSVRSLGHALVRRAESLDVDLLHLEHRVHGSGGRGAVGTLEHRHNNPIAERLTGWYRLAADDAGGRPATACIVRP